jgi:sialic acid synthase SpsE
MAIDTCNIWQGIVVGAVGGSLAGLTVWCISEIKRMMLECSHKKRLFNWMKENTEDLPEKRYHSTRKIASWNNLTEDRVRYICSQQDEIYQSTGKAEEMWGVYGIGREKSK